MESKKVLNLLKCTRQTLTKQVKNGIIRTTKLKNGYYDYNDEDIYCILSNNNRNNCCFTKLNNLSENRLLYDNFNTMLDDLLQFKIKSLIVNGYEIKDIDTLSYLCNKYGCTLEVR